MNNAAFLVAGKDATRTLSLLSNGLLDEDDKRMVERLTNSPITRGDIVSLLLPAHVGHHAAQVRLRVAVERAHLHA